MSSTGTGKKGYTKKELNKFLIPSLIGAVAFLLPIPQEHTIKKKLSTRLWA